MGDRGNIVVSSQSDGTMHFYTHWSGSELPQIVANGLKRGLDRWDDEQYLNRILFCELVKDDLLSDTGFGLSIQKDDGGTEVYVDHDKKTVAYMGVIYDFSDFVTKYGTEVTA